MKIKLTPRLCEQSAPSIFVSGSAVTIDGEKFDFEELPAGYELPAAAVSSAWFTGQVSKSKEGELTINLILPHDDMADESVRFPSDIEVEEGYVPLPFTEKKTEDEENDGD